MTHFADLISIAVRPIVGKDPIFYFKVRVTFEFLEFFANILVTFLNLGYDRILAHNLSSS
jgi:hypothetical protein